MEFDPNSTPPCYRTADSVSPATLFTHIHIPRLSLAHFMIVVLLLTISDQDAVIQEGNYIRVRVVGTRVDANDIVSLCPIV